MTTTIELIIVIISLAICVASLGVLFYSITKPELQEKKKQSQPWRGKARSDASRGKRI